MFPFLILAISSVFNTVAKTAQDRPLEVCELALRELVVNLELNGKFESASSIDELPGDSMQYSSCFVMPDERSVFADLAYHVFRGGDDVTVFVLRQPRSSGPWRIFGPFHSAYRK